MDIFAHGLWTYALFRLFNKNKESLHAVLFGTLPDLIPFVPFFFFMFFNGIKFEKHANIFPQYTMMAYNITHSLIIFLVAFLVIYFILRRIAWPLLGWGLHIIFDIPSHTIDFFPTPFLWPLSDFRVNGIQWSNKYFIFINYSLLIIIYIYIFVNDSQSKK